ncbi:hypothetical protein ROZALSC1DRAFT_29681 [Rozella allomycis CSF55]|uniref:Uncharacterized protein n=1 Tax=Rozella allomycis (strain CSF55) TaxID=988480 RepID=A0A4V1IZN2_ROZAC|nr:hypothetical protein ROZALSC1DRAFT_29681 [Rozella allomycis CSF55]
MQRYKVKIKSGRLEYRNNPLTSSSHKVFIRIYELEWVENQFGRKIRCESGNLPLPESNTTLSKKSMMLNASNFERDEMPLLGIIEQFTTTSSSLDIFEGVSARCKITDLEFMIKTLIDTRKIVYNQSIKRAKHYMIDLFLAICCSTRHFSNVSFKPKNCMAK